MANKIQSLSRPRHPMGRKGLPFLIWHNRVQVEAARNVRIFARRPNNKSPSLPCHRCLEKNALWDVVLKERAGNWDLFRSQLCNDCDTDIGAKYLCVDRSACVESRYNIPADPR
jgi:hypothetical protein